MGFAESRKRSFFFDLVKLVLGVISLGCLIKEEEMGYSRGVKRLLVKK
jgi:hypothetical protein